MGKAQYYPLKKYESFPHLLFSKTLVGTIARTGPPFLPSMIVSLFNSECSHYNPSLSMIYGDSDNNNNNNPTISLKKKNTKTCAPLYSLFVTLLYYNL